MNNSDNRDPNDSRRRKDKKQIRGAPLPQAKKEMRERHRRTCAN